MFNPWSAREPQKHVPYPPFLHLDQYMSYFLISCILCLTTFRLSSLCVGGCMRLQVVGWTVGTDRSVKSGLEMRGLLQKGVSERTLF